MRSPLTSCGLVAVGSRRLRRRRRRRARATRPARADASRGDAGELVAARRRRHDRGRRTRPRARSSPACDRRSRRGRRSQRCRAQLGAMPSGVQPRVGRRPRRLQDAVRRVSALGRAGRGAEACRRIGCRRSRPGRAARPCRRRGSATCCRSARRRSCVRRCRGAASWSSSLVAPPRRHRAGRAPDAALRARAAGPQPASSAVAVDAGVPPRRPGRRPLSFGGPVHRRRGRAPIGVARRCCGARRARRLACSLAADRSRPIRVEVTLSTGRGRAGRLERLEPRAGAGSLGPAARGSASASASPRLGADLPWAVIGAGP